MKRSALAVLTAALAAAPFASANVLGTKHDFSRTGKGQIKDRRESQVCKFCHAPHTTSRKGPLWNRRDPGSVYQSYASPSFDAGLRGRAPRPDGASLLCLSCHDGTIAVGSLLHGDRGRSEAPQIPSGSPANLGRDLSGMHPVSFAVTAELVTRNNAKDLPLRPVEEMRKAKVLDGRDRVQCTSCHDPHDDSNRQASGIPFYRRPDFSEVCALCHRF